MTEKKYSKPPLFKYDDRYIKNSEYTEEQLYELQSKISELKDSTDLKNDLKQSTSFSDKEIDSCLFYLSHLKIIKQDIQNSQYFF